MKRRTLVSLLGATPALLARADDVIE